MKALLNNFLISAIGLVIFFPFVRFIWVSKKLTINIRALIVSSFVIVLLCGMFYPDLLDLSGALTWEQRFDHQLGELEIKANWSSKGYKMWSEFSKMSSNSESFRWLVRSEYFYRVSVGLGVLSLLSMVTITAIVRKRNT